MQSKYALLGVCWRDKIPCTYKSLRHQPPRTALLHVKQSENACRRYSAAKLYFFHGAAIVPASQQLPVTFTLHTLVTKP